MKYLLLSLLFLTGCAEFEDTYRNAPIVNGENLSALSESCEELAKCIKGTPSIVHIRGQKRDPFVCEIKTKIESFYFYPDLSPLYAKPTFGRFEASILACEVATQTGKHSAEYVKNDRIQIQKIFKQMDKDRKQREKDEKDQKETIKSKMLPIKEDR